MQGLGDTVTQEIVNKALNTQFYFDTAGWAFPEQINGLLEHVSIDRIMYGSDFPWTPLKLVTELSVDHDKYLPLVFPDMKNQEALCKATALKLFGS